MQARAPSGLFPSAPQRPTYYEPHPVRMGAVLAGAAATAVWELVMGLFASSLSSYLWLTFTAIVVAWVVALLLVRHGDRGVATGIGLAAAVGGCVVISLAVVNWITDGWLTW